LTAGLRKLPITRFLESHQFSPGKYFPAGGQFFRGKEMGGYSGIYVLADTFRLVKPGGIIR
jgi:hypothetical protein